LVALECFSFDEKEMLFALFLPIIILDFPDSYQKSKCCCPVIQNLRKINWEKYDIMFEKCNTGGYSYGKAY
jgi:hypothetical protein